jgi:hypothetical protein
MLARQGDWNENVFHSLEDGPTAMNQENAAVHRLHGPTVPRLPLNRSDDG